MMEGAEIRATALAAIDRTFGGMSTWDIAKGPLASHAHGDMQELMHRILKDARKSRCISLYFSPPFPHSFPDARLSIRPSHRCEQASATRILDLRPTEEDILKQMKPKGRYNISVAKKHGVRVEVSEDVGAFHSLLKQTGKRDAFGIHPKSHYEAFLKALPSSFLLLAFAPSTSQPIAGLMGAIWNHVGIYYYGASSYANRAVMAPYLLQWHALTHCKGLGCVSYDLLGISPPDAGRDDPWAGITLYKEKFGGTIVSYPPEQHILLRPVLSTLLNLKRRFLG
jgi:lipid II:glycine glycyltransferase (peptidoglycan interpeptide bridge formation enzyme)